MLTTQHGHHVIESSDVTVEDLSRRRERFRGESTYARQLRAFAAAVRGEPPNLTPPSDSVATMSLSDDTYTAAGLPLRPKAGSRPGQSSRQRVARCPGRRGQAPCGPDAAATGRLPVSAGSGGP